MRRASLTSRRIFAAAACTLTLVVSAGAADQDSMGFGPDPELPAPQKKSLMPTVNIAPAAPWAEGAKPTAAAGFTVTRLRDGSRSSALAPTAAERRRACRRDQRARRSPTEGRPEGLGDEESDEARGRRRAERRIASCCCAMRTATASPKRRPSSSTSCTRRSAWRSSATPSTSPIPTRSCASSITRAIRSITAPGDKVHRPARRADQPSLDQEPDREPRRHASCT